MSSEQVTQLPRYQELEVLPGRLTRPQRTPSLLLKDFTDRLGSLLLLFALSPALLLIALLIRLDSPGPALFRQTRVGLRHEPFTCFKFRTMTVNCDDDVHRSYIRELIENDTGAVQDDGRNTAFKLLNDSRITRIGRFLRKASLDELPQLINVLRGEMSLVGPRPAIAYEVEMYEPWQLQRLEVKPGITGLWQVSGRSLLTYRDALILDIRYVQNWSIFLDFKILFMTIPVVLSRKGAV